MSNVTIADLIPSGNTAQRPSNPTEGPASLRYNTEDHAFEFWNGTEWACWCGDGGGGDLTLETPEVMATAGDGFVDLDWDDIANATSYQVWRNTSNTITGATLLNDDSASEFQDTTVVNGTLYYYFVIAVAPGYTSSEAGTDSATPEDEIDQLGTPQNFGATGGDTTVDLDWDNVLNATSYTLLRNLTNTTTGATSIYTGSVSAFTDTGRTNGLTYYYFVKATAAGYTDSSYASVSGTPVAPTVQLTTPAFTATPVSSSQIDLTGITYDPASVTMIAQRSTNPAFPPGLTTVYSGVPVSSASDVGLDDETLYYYRIKTTAPGYIDSAYATDSATTEAMSQLDTPAGFVVTPADGTINLAWDAVPNATNYLSYVNTVNTFSGATLFASAGTPAAISSGLTNGTTYYYFVVATAPGYIDSNPGTTSGVPTGSTFTATAYHSATDPFVNTSTDPTTGATVLRSVTPALGANIVIQLNDFPFEYFILEYDDTEPDVTAFFDTAFHNGPIPDGFEWRPIFSVGGKKYLTTYNQAAFDATPATVSFTH